jgi:hypothetical protein
MHGKGKELGTGLVNRIKKSLGEVAAALSASEG